MQKDPCYYEGYLAGYRDGVKDAVSGKAVGWRLSDIGKTPVQAMGLSTRAYNCLTHYGCHYAEDVAALSSDTIMRMRNLGRKTSSEIAKWLTDHGILSSAWTEYL